MLEIRKFADACEGVAKDWRRNIVTSDEWTPSTDDVTQGEMKGFLVRNGGHGGYAKPGPGVVVDYPATRAGHEKIVSDLAHDLGLPVPPVLLWERTGVAVEAERFCCISFIPFPNLSPWSRLLPSQTMRLRDQLAPYASAMIAFDTWVGNTDRHNPGNLLLAEDIAVQGAPVLRVAYIDYANSLSHGWHNSENANTVTCIPAFPAGLKVDMDQLASSVERIEAFSADSISDIVGRIPAHFVPDSKRASITDVLIARRAVLRQAIQITYSGLK